MEEIKLFDIKKLGQIKKAFEKSMNLSFEGTNVPSSFVLFAQAIEKNRFSSQQELSSFLGCNKAHTSRMLVKMQLKGFVKPIYHGGIELTEKGLRLAKAADNARKQFKQSLLHNIDEKELLCMSKVIDKLVENAKQMEGDANE